MQNEAAAYQQPSSSHTCGLAKTLYDIDLIGQRWDKLKCFLVPKSQTMMHTNSYLHPLLVILWSHS